jgi:hypothetical protein
VDWPGYQVLGLVSGALSVATLNQARALANLFVGPKCFVLPSKKSIIRVLAVDSIRPGPDGVNSDARGWHITVTCETENKKTVAQRLGGLSLDTLSPKDYLPQAGFSIAEIETYDPFRGAFFPSPMVSASPQ